jgi:formate/nitrite transporter
VDAVGRERRKPAEKRSFLRERRLKAYAAPDRRRKPSMPEPEEHRLDALLPAEIAAKAEDLGVRKAAAPALPTFVLAVLGGAFIALGAVFSTAASAGAGGAVPYGIQRLLAGTVFSLGLLLVVVGGAELFTGNNLIVMAAAGGRITLAALLRNWVIVLAGNFAGAAATAAVVFLGGQYRFGDGAVGLAALATAEHKCALDFSSAFFLGVMCNALVCLAVWLSYGGRSVTDKAVAVLPPIAAFVTAGFEHSVANMYFVPAALMIKAGAPEAFWAAVGRGPESFPHLTWSAFLTGNLPAVTLGNIVGGAGMVGLVYWFVYLRPKRGAGSV